VALLIGRDLKELRLLSRLPAVVVLAGFGAPCVIATVFLPFHIGAALVNMLFPVFVLVACGCDPVAAQGE